MSFLTNSDNIIDAVLTRKGRELLTKGQFNITKYAFSDDGINYNLYDETAGQDADADILSLPILLNKNNIHFKHMLEWNYFVGVILFYLFSRFFWRRTT